MAKKKFSSLVLTALVALMVALVTGCSTGIPVTYTEPAKLNMSNITRIGIVPFKTVGNAELQQQTVASIASYLNEQLSSTGKFTLVSLTPGQDYTSTADAVISGQIIRLDVQDTSKTEQRTRTTDNGQKVQVSVTTYTRTLNLSFSYSIVRTRDNSQIKTETKSGKKDSSKEDRNALADPYDLVQQVIRDAFKTIASDTAPTPRSVKLTLAKEDSKDKELKKLMSNAEKMAKAKDYSGAAAAFGSIYEQYDNFAAGYNQAMLTEATEGIAEATRLMTAVSQKHSDPKASAALAGMRQRDASNQQSAAQDAQQGESLSEAAINQACTELLAKLPEGSRISLSNVSRTDTALLEYVIGEITVNLANKGITVLDRQNQSLLNMEKQYQSSGDVSDDSMVSIGHALGLTSMVTCSIDGEGHLRRLRVRAVDIETGAIIYTGAIEI